MALSVRAKNFILGGSLATFASSVFGYTFYQMSRVRAVRESHFLSLALLVFCRLVAKLMGSLLMVLPSLLLLLQLQDDFKDLDTVKVNVHQTGIKPSAPGKHDS
ncbi:hypothetical protein PR001_g16652 [Phytophthora rubi]|uniref:Uncharacterized protein n=1 Tax=Phytophthora rubi TaxID=129364 RepID=A0A6A3KGI1_9STRA|nr:hypothetical protein PR002_g16685 [Phytophthora rubi]KAE9008605.1 hypothetical protein PR001_g16652 [Phytophthora rubi]